MGPRSSSPANMDASVSQTCFHTVPSLLPSEHLEFLPTYMSVVYALALKQTQAVDPQLKTETQAEVSTDSPVPVSIEAVSTRCQGVCELPLLSWICVWEEIQGILLYWDCTFGLSVCGVTCCHSTEPSRIKKSKMCTGCKYVCQSWNICETFLFFIQVVSGNMIDVGTELCAL